MNIVAGIVCGSQIGAMVGNGTYVGMKVNQLFTRDSNDSHICLKQLSISDEILYTKSQEYRKFWWNSGINTEGSLKRKFDTLF